MKRVRTQNVELEQVQSNVDEVLRVVEGSPTFRARLIENVTITTVPADIAHGLGRPLVGFIPVRIDCDSRIYEPSRAAIPDRNVRLQATANVVASLIVF